MKLFCDLLTRRRSNKKKEMLSPINISSNNAIQSINQSISTCYDQTSSLFDKQTRCTCHYFLNNRILPKKLISTDLTSSDIKTILTIADFCFWYDVRSTLFDIIDRVVAMDDIHHCVIPRTIIKFCLPQSNTIPRRIRRPKTSIAIQTVTDYDQRRNAKVQANTLTLFPIQKQNISSGK